MHIIHALASGVVGAENGLARLFRRGTSTRATWYSDFEASAANSSGDDIPLDATGGSTVYVNELVLVRVYSSIGQLIREFVAGEQAYAVEVISQSFTGTNYDSGAQAPAEPTTAGEVFDRWFESAGAIDWKGSYSGEAADLQNIFGAIYGIFYNVKSPEFGAEGDGAENDTAALQAAHDAALAAGGGVVFAPPGSYLYSAALSWSTGVHLVGMPGTVRFRQTTAAQNNLSLTASIAGGAKTPTIIYGIRFDSTVSNSAAQLNIGHGSTDEVHVLNCYLGGSANAAGSAIVLGGTNNWRTLVRDCVIQAQADTTAIFDTSSAGTGQLDIEGCQLLTPSTAFDDRLVLSAENKVNIRNCEFVFQASSGTPVGAMVDQAGVPLTVSGSRFRYISGPSAYAIELVDDGIAHFADDNVVDVSGMLRYKMDPADFLRVNTSYLAMGAFLVQTVNAATATLNNEYRSMFVRSTHAAEAPDLELPKAYYAGQSLDIVVMNDSGSNWGDLLQFNYPDGDGYDGTRATCPWPTQNDETKLSFRFVAMQLSGAPFWVQIGETQATAFT